MALPRARLKSARPDRTAEGELEAVVGDGIDILVDVIDSPDVTASNCFRSMPVSAL